MRALVAGRPRLVDFRPPGRRVQKETGVFGLGDVTATYYFFLQPSAVWLAMRDWIAIGFRVAGLTQAQDELLMKAVETARHRASLIGARFSRLFTQVSQVRSPAV